MNRVIVESPYSAPNPTRSKINEIYAEICLKDCILRGEAPFASHLLYTRTFVLDDCDAEERKLGIEVGLSWYDVANLCAVYSDIGISKGMQLGIERAKQKNVTVEYRSLLHDTSKFPVADIPMLLKDCMLNNYEFVWTCLRSGYSRGSKV